MVGVVTTRLVWWVRRDRCGGRGPIGVVTTPVRVVPNPLSKLTFLLNLKVGDVTCLFDTLLHPFITPL